MTNIIEWILKGVVSDLELRLLLLPLAVAIIGLIGYLIRKYIKKPK